MNIPNIRKFSGKPLALSFILALALSACASYNVPIVNIAPEDTVMPVGASADPSLPEILDEIRRRNREVEDDAFWIEDAYEELKIRSLKTVSGREYENYKKYVEAGSVYIIVHPAYFTFFHSPALPPLPTLSQYNVVEQFLSLPPRDSKMALMQAQERRMRDFLEYKSTKRSLVVLILPRAYKKYKGYTYKGGPDEYTRFLNEITNESESVLYIESRSASRGHLRDEDMTYLIPFLAGLEADKILVGGGYVGRCVENFYTNLTDDYGSSGVFLVPELADISPSELNNRLVSELLEPSGQINLLAASDALRKDVYNVQEVIPQVFNLK